jgi:uncharacterized ferritin-like protein (DUF455 family)
MLSFGKNRSPPPNSSANVCGMTEIRTYAEQVLYGETLALKLVSPGRVTDLKPGAALTKSILPNRPEGLALCAPRHKRSRFPTRSDLELDEGRGRVLHFFANHELLALELMALTLLRFPEAPARFRRCLVATMRDEQKHMQLYLDRMNDLGVELGEIPLNSFFWDLLSKVDTLPQFVAGMSLTFEQANIDFSLHYKEQFEQVGDQITAAIMDQVLEDEIAHVRHGVNFFQTHILDTVSLWSSYTQSLVYPLTPARAKGHIFTRHHRVQAGLDEEFIANLEVYTHSKGRVPNVWLFNPGVESALAYGGQGYTAPRSVTQLTEDLETLPMFLSSPDDIVLVQSKPSTSHLVTLKSLGYHLPEFIETRRGTRKIEKDNPLIGRKLNELRPWGWAPDIATFLAPLARAARVHDTPLLTLAKRQTRLYSKVWLTERITACIGQIDPAFAPHVIAEHLPVHAQDRVGVENVIDTLGAHGIGTIVIKAPFGSAGGAQIRILNHAPTTSQWKWVERVLKHQNGVIIEPWYDNRLDGSYLFKITADGAFVESGLTHFFTDSQGRYRGTALGPLSDTMPSELKRFFFRAGGTPDWVERTLKQLAKTLTKDLHAHGLSGNVGMDFMVVKTSDGQYKLRSPLELNPRSTMGHVARAIGRPFGTRARGLWCLVTQQDLKLTGHGDFTSLVNSMQTAIPQEFKGEPARLVRGVFCTTPTTTSRQVCSICIVDKRFNDVLAHASNHLRNPLYTKMLHERHILD